MYDWGVILCMWKNIFVRRDLPTPKPIVMASKLQNLEKIYFSYQNRTCFNAISINLSGACYFTHFTRLKSLVEYHTSQYDSKYDLPPSSQRDKIASQVFNF